jgi:hypothetical protein
MFTVIFSVSHAAQLGHASVVRVIEKTGRAKWLISEHQVLGLSKLPTRCRGQNSYRGFESHLSARFPLTASSGEVLRALSSRTSAPDFAVEKKSRTNGGQSPTVVLKKIGVELASTEKSREQVENKTKSRTNREQNPPNTP